MSVIVNFLERAPHIEVLARRFLWAFPDIKNGVIKKYDDGKKNTKINVIPESWDTVKTTISGLGIKKGDLLLVHSSMDGLVKTGASAKQIIDFLLEMVGDEGTLVFAAYPKCEPYKEQEDVLYYDPKRTLSWTGLLPNVFCRYPGVIRSPFPYNTLAAKGPLAEEMMKDNLECDTSQGEYSSWNYCVNHHAKALYLGVSAAMSCTMMNYPEDAMGDLWYVDNWYHNQKYVIKHQGNLIEKTIRERNPEWYRFYAMFYSERWLLKNNFLVRFNPQGVYVGYTDDIYPLAQRLLEDAKNQKSVYIIPKKYRKK